MFGGIVTQATHASKATATSMDFTVFTPPQSSSSAKVPVLYYLSGLTCTDANVNEKAGAQRYAAENGIALVMPDTSPRGHPEILGENDAYDFGTGAGFYVNATTDSFKDHYRMFEYVTEELPATIASEFPVIDTSNASIFGHSMGGHGALIAGLKTGAYKSVSAFAPICNPTTCPWGEKAFTGYLGSVDAGREWDACELLAGYEGPPLNILVDQGTCDNFLEEQLKPETLEAACSQAGQPLTLNMRDGYDHSYYFIASFMEDHIRHHAKFLHGN